MFSSSSRIPPVPQGIGISWWPIGSFCSYRQALSSHVRLSSCPALDGCTAHAFFPWVQASLNGLGLINCVLHVLVYILCSSLRSLRSAWSVSVLRWSHSPCRFCIFRTSHVHLLDGASVSRPHNCQPQRIANNQSVGGRLGNHNAAPHCCEESDWANSPRLCRLVLFLVTLCSTVKSGSRHGYFCRQLQLSIFIAYGLDWAWHPRHYVHELVVFPLHATHTCTSPNSIHQHVFNLSLSIDVWHSPPDGTYRYDKNLTELILRAYFCSSMRQIIRALKNGAVQPINNSAIRCCNM